MHKFNPLDHPICLSVPLREVPFLSWHQHIPFAMLLVDILRPKILVELGAHYGDSYCAFCQAVAELQLRTACYAVDTWEGDPHASFYGPEVLADLTAHHDPLYGGFSRLIKSTFDDALQHFTDGTIDILHIDGYHTYEAVKHDFETWLPKMNSRGVILFHDINVKEKDFGVWKWWDEIKQHYPHFGFLHCNGLGILAVGEKVPEELRWLFEAGDEEASAIQNFFFRLGERLTAEFMAQGKDARISDLENTLMSVRQEQNSRINALENTLASVRQEKDSRIQSLEATIESLKLEKDLRINNLEATLASIGQEKDLKIQPCLEINTLQSELDIIRNSTTWRVAQKMHSVINAVLPVGTKRRAFTRRLSRTCWLMLIPGKKTSSVQNESRLEEINSTNNPLKANYISKIVEVLEKSPRITEINAQHLVDVVVPIYNAYEDFEKCLYSLFKYQDIYTIILIDDCSTDKRVQELLRTLKEHECDRFKIAENEENIGYLKTVNKGMKMSKKDVILVNTDTVVTNGYAKKMRECAYSHDRIATVTPFTNNGTMVSIPEFLKNNDIPEGFTIDSFAECVEKSSFNQYPELVTAVGFCMYIKRGVIDEIGYFDEEKFKKGYGEEGDFSARAVLKGYKNVLCDNTFIFHKGRASFLDAQDDLLQKNHEVLAKLHPGFFPAIGRFERTNPLKEIHNNIKKQMATWNISS
ncbi:MAG: class I SAM-dependent methyltransferase [Smithellaceae bacterium]